MAAGRQSTLIERLDDRRYMAAFDLVRVANAAAEQAPSPQAVFKPLVVLNDRGTLSIRGTSTEDSIRLRKLPNGQLQLMVVSVASMEQLNNAKPVPDIAIQAGERQLKTDTNVAVTVDEVAVISEFRIDFKAIKRVMVNSGEGHDVLRLDRVVLPIEGSGVERLIRPEGSSSVIKPVPVQPAAPANYKPWRPAAGQIGGSEQRWQQELQKQLKRSAQSETALAFFGDSHAERFPYYGRRAWLDAFPEAFNLGLSGDNTRQLLERIRAGIFDQFKPDRLVLMIGTNNLNDPATAGTDGEIVRGIRTVIEALRERLPNTRIVVVSILPRRQTGLNERIEVINNAVKRLVDNKTVFYLDVYDSYKGTPHRVEMFLPDNDHLNARGYRLLASALKDLLSRI